MLALSVVVTRDISTTAYRRTAGMHRYAQNANPPAGAAKQGDGNRARSNYWQVTSIPRKKNEPIETKSKTKFASLASRCGCGLNRHGSNAYKRSCLQPSRPILLVHIAVPCITWCAPKPRRPQAAMMWPASVAARRLTAERDTTSSNISSSIANTSGDAAASAPLPKAALAASPSYNCA